MARRRLIWAGLCLAALALYLFDNSTATRWTFLAVVLLPLLTALPLLTRPRVTLAWQVPEAAHRGEELSCALLLSRQGGLLPPPAVGRVEVSNLLTGEKTVLPLRCRVKAGEHPLPIVLTSAHTGAVTLRAEGSLRDPFGLFVLPLPPAEGKVLVEPILFPVEEPSTSLRQEGELHSSLRPGSDPSETFQLREYVPGDPVRQIHWKLSEKLDKALIRELGLPLGETRLELAPSPAGADAIDRDLDLLFSLGRVFCAEGQPVTVQWPAAGATRTARLTTQEEWDAFRAELLSTPLQNVRLRPEWLSELY